MQRQLKKTYKFAFKTALYLTLCLTLLLGVFLYKFYRIDWIQITLIALICFIFSFIIIQTTYKSVVTSDKASTSDETQVYY